MTITINEEDQSLSIEQDGETKQMPLYSNEAFELLSDIYLKVNWNQKYPYSFSWLGRPIIQLPDDMIRLQEVIFDIKPDVIIETGIAHGGSLIFYASLLKAMGKGRVIGIDIEIRPHNRTAIETHPMFELIEMIEGGATDQNIVEQVASKIAPGEKTLIILDSNHSYDHVTAELKAYSGMVTPGSYIVATDGCMRYLADVPRGQADWAMDNPAQAAEDFARDNPDFILEQPAWSFNESTLSKNVTHWPSAYLKRKA